MLYSILLCWLALLTRICYGAAADSAGLNTVAGSRYPDMCGVVGGVFHWTIPVYDSSDGLHVARYGRVHLPAWLRLNNATLSGVPLHTDLGAVTLSVWVNNKFHMLVGLDVRPHHCPTALQPHSAFTTDYPLSNRVSCNPFTTKLIALVLCDADTVAPQDRVGLLLRTASILTLHYSAVTLTSLSTALSTGHYYFLYTDTTIELNDTVAVLAELTCTVEDSKLWHAILMHPVRAHNLTILLAEYTPLLPWVRRKRKITSPGSNQMLIHQPQILEIDITETLDISTTSSTLSIASSTVSMLTSSTTVSVTSTLFLITSSRVTTSSTELTGTLTSTLALPSSILVSTSLVLPLSSTVSTSSTELIRILTSSLFIPFSSTVTTSLVLQPSSTVSTSLVFQSSSTVSTRSTELTRTLISSLFNSSITVTSSLFLSSSSTVSSSLFIPTSSTVTTSLFIPTSGRVTTSSFLPTLLMTSVTVPTSSIFTNSSAMISSVASSSVLSPIILETTMLFPNTSILPSLSSIIAGFSSIVSSLSTVIIPTPTPPTTSSSSSSLLSISVESSILTHPTTITSSIPPITTSVVMISSTTLLTANSSVFNFTSMLMSSSTLASTTRVMASRTHRSTPITTPIPPITTSIISTNILSTPITTSIISTNILSTTPITSSIMSSLLLSSISSPTMATQTLSISSLTFITPPNTTTIMATRTRSTPIITTIMATQRPITTIASTSHITNTSIVDTQSLITTTILPTSTAIMATQTLSTPITTTILPTSTAIMSTQTLSTPITTTILPTSTAIMATQTLSTPITTTILPTSTAIMSTQTLSTPITTTILPTSTAIMSTQTLSTPITTTTIMSTQIPTTTTPPITTIIINNPPNLIEPLKLRDITPGMPYNRSIAEVFSNETALSYTVMQLGDNPIPGWIELIDDYIILLAPIAEQGKYFYILLVAIDMSGMEAVDTIEIELLEILQPLYTISISILTSLSLWDRYNIMTRIETLISDAGLVDYTVRNMTNGIESTTTLLKLFVIGGGQLDCDAQNETDLFRLIYNSTVEQYDKMFTMTIDPYEVNPEFLPDVTGNCVQNETDAPPTISISLSLEYDPTTFTISAVLCISIAVLMICTCFLCLCCVYRYYRYQPLPSKERAAFQSRRPVVIDNDPSPTHKGRYVVVLNEDLEDSPQDTEATEPLISPESMPVRRLPKLPKERPPPLFKLPSRLLVTDK